MSGGITIKFDFDKLPGNPGEKCQSCKLIVEEIKYVPFLQVGDATEVIYFPFCYCEKCYEMEISPE